MPLDMHETHDEIGELFGPDSPLARSLAGFAPREGQAHMAAVVAETIAKGETLVVEAGTGTGKTLAYLVPALLSGARVILSTGTKTLQDQLFHRDLPVVTSALGRAAKVVQLKGRSNYLCLHRLQSTGANSYDQAGAHYLPRIKNWSLTTRSGDIVELADIPENSAIWPQVTSTQENCLGAKCDFYDRCHVIAARQSAQKGDIVVVNHHLLLADMLLKDEGFGELLPGFDAVVIDEAHQFPDIAQGFFNVSLTSRSLIDLANDYLSEGLTALAGDQEPGQLANALTKAVRDLRLALPNAGSNIEWAAAGDGLTRQLDSLVECLDELIVSLDDLADDQSGLLRCRERACKAVDSIEQISSADETAGLRWLGLSRLGFSLNYTPVDVAAGLRKLLTARPCAWVFTSATLAVADNFAHFEKRMGLEDARSLVIPSPFDNAAAGLLYLPTNMPEPSAANYTRKMLAELRPLIDASGGRAFLLFTSHRALREAAEILRASDDFEYPLLVQGEAPRSKLLEQFAQLADPVLLGTASFWEGVDMRGDSLVLVAIDRLPFASPGDPMLKARLDAIAKEGGKPFTEYQVPQAVLALKQGVGRLIRDHADRGVVVICDPRITSKGYGKKFLASMPAFPVTRDGGRAEMFLADIMVDKL
jgi:ATP-dependent DNA helicase DinG